ncbi:GNAT family N-acetyltransferase [candidate division WOR-3 bacterium]|jgi:RimJ/RimL family protein N-acetyltransferase|nr:GNAT family N-acetyltransferase [candidate division WOR-3 bacterium]
MKKKLNKKMNNPYLISKNCYLRPVEINDAPLIQKWHNDPELRKLGSGSGLPVTKEKEEKDIKSAYSSKDEAYLMVIKKKNNKAIGFIRINCLLSTSKNVWLRMIIGDKKAWGKGYAQNALGCFLRWLFYELNIHRITLETYATNIRAIKFFEKMGFKKEGVLREAHFNDERYHDIISYGLLKKEFEKIK